MSAHLRIVENDETLADQIAEQMGHYGHSATVTHDGRAAIQAVGLEAFDAIILDRMLPKADGISVLRSLRDARIVTPVLMLTALGQSAQKVEGLDAGADDYAVKPVDPAELNARIHALIRARKWQGESPSPSRGPHRARSPPQNRAPIRHGRAARRRRCRHKPAGCGAENSATAPLR